MILRWLVKIAAGVAIAGFLVVELGSPLWTRASLDGTAHDAANDAAHEYFQTHDEAFARQTATKDAEDKGARLDAFSIDDKFSQTRHWYDVRVSASATPD